MSSFGSYTDADVLSINCTIKSTVEGSAKCSTVPQRCEFVTGTHAAGQGSR